MTRIGIIGASGFIGQYLMADLTKAGFDVSGFDRKSHGDFQTIADWATLLEGFDCIIHLAARVHRVHENKQDAAAYHAANVDLTRAVLDGAEKAGVKTFVFLSSAAVYGGSVDDTGQRFAENDAPAPITPYGQSKLDAENLMEGRDLRCISIRAPMVYGKGCRANFLSLAKAIQKSIPLPLASVKNARSFLYVGNLSSFIQHVFKNDTLQGIYNLSDEEDISTPDLVRKMGAAMAKTSVLIPFPVSLMSGLIGLAGMKRQRDGLLRSFQLDITHARETGWAPQYSVDEGLKEALKDF